MKILIDTNKLPWSNSHFMRSLESSTERFGFPKLYNDYVEVAGFSGLNMLKADSMLNSFFAMWKEAISFIGANSSIVKTLHARVRNNIDYYGKDSFLRGMSARVESLIDKSLFVEAAHYVFRTSVSLLENYVWLVSTMEKKRFDFTTLFKNLTDSAISPKEVYKKAEEAFGVQEVSAQKAESFLRKTKETIFNIHQKRKELVSFVS